MIPIAHLPQHVKISNASVLLIQNTMKNNNNVFVKIHIFIVMFIISVLFVKKIKIAKIYNFVIQKIIIVIVLKELFNRQTDANVLTDMHIFKVRKNVTK